MKIQKIQIKIDHLALIVCLVAVAATAWIGSIIFETLPHIEDEVAYVWQANTISRGELTLQSPLCPKCFLVPFVVDYNGLRFGKYPIAWPVLLSFAIRVGKRAWLPPLLAELNIGLAYSLFKKILDKKTALLAIILTVMSPFFLMNASSLLAHNWSLFLTLSFVIGWVDTFSTTSKVPRWLTSIVSALSLGALALTRPMTAVGVAIPFFIHGSILLFGKDNSTRRRVIWIGLIAGLISSLHFLWQYSVTGNPWLNPYELWWPYDKIGFGPDVGLQTGGFTPRAAYSNTVFSLWIGSHDVFGWPYLSYIFIPFGIIALIRCKKAWTVSLIFPSLVLIYNFYWIGSWLFGPRYYFEGLISISMLTAAGIDFLIGKKENTISALLAPKINTVKNIIVSSLVGFLILGNLLFYLPTRIGSLRGLYGHQRSQMEPFQTEQAQALTPALVIVHMQHSWVEYGTLLELSSPFNDTPFVFTFSRGEEEDQKVADVFPERNIFHYYADKPYKFYTAPRIP